jgi:hypothetical protein
LPARQNRRDQKRTPPLSGGANATTQSKDPEDAICRFREFSRNKNTTSSCPQSETRAFFCA